MTPDDNRACGGIRHIYRMVDVLNEKGVEACVFHSRPGFSCTWFSHRTRIQASSRLHLEQGDVLITPEVNHLRAYARTAAASVVVLNQNHFNTFGGAGIHPAAPHLYPGWPNAVAVLTTSNRCRAFVEGVVHRMLPVHSVRYVVDTDLFIPSRKRKTMAFMPRKRRNDVEAVIQLLRRSRSLEGWEFLPIEGMNETEVARVLGSAAVFLSFSEREGFGLPPAEAMAAGCYVIGFTGDGGREFMVPNVCSPVEDPDLLGFVKEVERVAGEWRGQDTFMSEARNRGRAHILSRYNRTKMREDVERAFTALTAKASHAPQRSAVEVTHVSWLTPAERIRTVLRRRILGAFGMHSNTGSGTLGRGPEKVFEEGG